MKTRPKTGSARRWIGAVCLIAILQTDACPTLPATPQAAADDSALSAKQASALENDQHASAPVFETDVRPILEKKCIRCHNAKTKKADLDLSTPAGVTQGGESGKIVMPKLLDESLLYEMVHEEYMPPEGEPALTSDEIATIGRWISSGAIFEKPVAEQANRVTDHDVIPILHLRCVTCHGLRRKEANLDLRTKATMLVGGDSGPAIVPGKPEESLLLKRVHAGEMPPGKKLVAISGKPIEPPEIEIIERWITAGAPESTEGPDIAGTTDDPLVSDEDREFWAFQSPVRPALPTVNNSKSIRLPIDRFIQHRLEQVGLALAEETDRTTLIRRLYLDLIGLPPRPNDVRRFVDNPGPDAYEQLVDQLLASHQYGERWARRWLDLAGYSDSEGIQNADVVRPHVYRYRDYVIRAMNADKPYNRFLLEQIAGDELVDYRNAPIITDEIYDNLVATAFLRLSTDGTYSNITAFVPDRLKVVEQGIEVLTSSVMGITMKCARCHTHKFDPIPHRDYYRFTAIFKGAYDEHDWLMPTRQSSNPGERDRYLPFVTTAEYEVWKNNEDSIDSEVKTLRAERADLLKAAREKLIAKLVADLTDDVLRDAWKTHADKRTKAQQDLLRQNESLFQLEEKAVAEQDHVFRDTAKSIDAQIKAAENRRQPQPLIRALWDRGVPSPTFVHRRGNYQTPGKLVGPGVPSMLTDGRTPFDIQPPFPNSDSTGRRLAFARWLVQPNHPLTARVFVNRIWKEHFGEGIVRTLENFGKSGTPPTHPELLDWLAVEFVERGYSMKSLHRMLVCSATYRQSSRISAQQLAADPDNRLLSRYPLRRLDAESVRDSLLLVAGQLDRNSFGPPVAVNAEASGLVTSVRSNRGWRRSLYVLQRRTQIPTILQSFDLPQMSPNCVTRSESIVSPQALHLLNNRFVHELAEHFAKTLLAEVGHDRQQLITRAYQLAFGRDPSSEEIELTMQSFDRLSATWHAEVGGQEQIIKTKHHLWIREIEPDTVYENDLVSVWSQSARDGGRRFGLIEFDVSQLAGVDLRHAHIDFGLLNRGRFRQQAAFIPPGIEQTTWNIFQETKAAAIIPCESLGTIDLDGSQYGVGEYVGSQKASSRDLELLMERAATAGRVAFVLTAIEDGTAYSHDWDDGVYSSTQHKPPRLIVRDDTNDPRLADRKALVNLCHALLNSAEFLYID